MTSLSSRSFRGAQTADDIAPVLDDPVLIRVQAALAQLALAESDLVLGVDDPP